MKTTTSPRSLPCDTDVQPINSRKVLSVPNTKNPLSTLRHDRIATIGAKRTEIKANKLTVNSPTITIAERSPITTTTGPEQQALILGPKIGEGAFGVAFLAKLKGVDVVLKCIPLMSSSNPLHRSKTAEKSAEMEEKVLVATKGLPHVVQHMTSFTMPIKHYGWCRCLVLERAWGQDLAGLVSRNGQLSYRNAALLFLQILDGLSNLHRAGFVHLDVKPGNILLRYDATQDGRLHALVADFGCSQRLPSNLYLKIPHNCESGSPSYQSPEELGPRGANEAPTYLNHSSDWYSAVLVFYNMVTGRHAYRYDPSNVAATREATRSSSFDRLSPAYLAVPPLLRQLIERTICEDPRARLSLKEIRSLARNYILATLPLSERQALSSLVGYDDDHTAREEFHARVATAVAEAEQKDAEAAAATAAVAVAAANASVAAFVAAQTAALRHAREQVETVDRPLLLHNGQRARATRLPSFIAGRLDRVRSVLAGVRMPAFRRASRSSAAGEQAGQSTARTESDQGGGSQQQQGLAVEEEEESDGVSSTGVMAGLGSSGRRSSSRRSSATTATTASNNNSLQRDGGEDEEAEYEVSCCSHGFMAAGGALLRSVGEMMDVVAAVTRAYL